MKAIRRPSGDQRGVFVPAGWAATCAWRDPSASTIQIVSSRT
jgi:hypothetical protein